MALINCPECKRLISDTADFCPHCGFKLSQEIVEEIKRQKENKRTKIDCLIFLILFAILIVIGIYEIATMTPEEKRKMAYV